MTQVVMYGTRFCPFCVAARRLLRAKGITFEDVSLDGNSQQRAKVMADSGRRTVPQIWIGERHIGGFTDLQELERNGELEDIANSGVESPETVAI